MAEMLGRMLEVVSRILRRLPEAEVLDVVIEDSRNEWVTYNAKVSLMNPYITPILISDVSCTLKCKTANRVIVSGLMEAHPEPLPGNQRTVLEVPMRVAHKQLLELENIDEAWDSIYQLDLVVTIDLPYSAGHQMPLPTWSGKIQMPQ